MLLFKLLAHEEQGRGFAVVATKSGNFTGRSAEVAKEIKALIGAGVDQVELGTILIDQAGQSMDEVVTAITLVREIVVEISSAISEQSSSARSCRFFLADAHQ